MLAQAQWRVDRVEHKFSISPSAAAKPYSRLQRGLLSDPNNHAGGYSVKSLYFDDLDDNCYCAKADGLFFRQNL